MHQLKVRFSKLISPMGVAIASAVLSLGLMVVAAAPQASQALTTNDFDTTGVTNSLLLGTTTPDQLTINIINWALGLLALIAVIIILIGGFTWMTAGGNEEKTEKAKKLLIAGLIGIVIILAGWGIATYVINNLLTLTNAGQNS